jgi:outer membrane protein OmpA-like peptidoglycan-associated protein/tetratricopeptide (TPR) repeat protein
MNHKTILFFTALWISCFFWQSAPAQQDVRIPRGDFKIENKQGFKSAWKNRRLGDRYYDKGYGFYDQALEHFQKAHQYNPDNAPLNYKMGVCYLKTDQYAQAIELFNKALSTDEHVAVDVYYWLGRAYHLNEQFDNAIGYYQRSLEPDIIEDLEQSREKINLFMRQCSNGKELIKEPVRVNINNLGPVINSQYDDYGPVFTRDGSAMYFTSRRKHEDNDKRWLGDQKFYSDIYRSSKNEGQWKPARLIHEDIYSSHNDAVVALTDDPRRIYVYRGQKDQGDIYYYEKDGDKWRGPKNFSRMINTNAKESAMCFTRDGSTVYFVSTLQEQSMGKKDIFMSRRDADGKWSRPVNLGGLVNTSLNEEGVFINSTSDKLYFSSEGHNSMGGYDLFVSEQDASGNWKEPRNLGYPVNTPGDDILFRKIEGENNKAYYASAREDSYGGKDLYEIIFLGEEREYSYTPVMDPIAWNFKPRQEDLYRPGEKLAIDTTIYLVGRIIDTASDEGIQAKVEIIDNDQNKVVATHLSDTTGMYTIRLQERKKYGLEITAKDYLFFAKTLNLNQEEIRNDTIRKNFTLDKVEIGKKVVLENIYFETNSSKLKTASYPELERVARLMKDNPGIKLEISGHTDNVGSYLANKKLSEARARSVVEYLVQQGVARSRLTYKGYSFTQPIAPNDTPQGRQKNRRVEFKVLEK